MKAASSQQSPQQKLDSGPRNGHGPLIEGHSSIHKCQSPQMIEFASNDGHGNHAAVIGHQFEIESREKRSPLVKELAQMHRSNMVSGRIQFAANPQGLSEFLDGKIQSGSSDEEANLSDDSCESNVRMTAQTVEVNGFISRKDQSQCQSPMNNREDSSNAFNFSSRERSNSDEFNQV